MHNPTRRSGTAFAMVVALSVAPVACSDTGKTQTDQNELSKLFAPPIDMDDLQWLEGAWGVVTPSEPTDAACGTFDGNAYVSFDMSDRYRPVLNAQPEPSRPDAGRSDGWSLIAEDNDAPGFANVTPRDWEDAYLKFRPLGDDKAHLEVQLFAFNKDETAWHHARTFYLEKCVPSVN